MHQIGDGFGDAAGHGKAAPRAGSFVQVILFLHGIKVDLFCLEHTLQFLKGQHEVHVGADVRPDGFQLFCGTRTHEDHLAAGEVLLDHPGGEHHGRQGHGNLAHFSGVQLLDHGVPSGATGGRHVVLLLRHLFQKILGFLDGTQVSADGDFHHPVEAQLLHGGHELSGGHLAAELPDEGGGDNGNDAVAFQDGLNDLKDLPLIHNGAEGAGHQALTAGHAPVLIDLCPAVFVGGNGIHAAGRLTGTFQMDNGMVGAGTGALAALDALLRVNVAFAVDEGDRALGADLLAGGGQTVLAVLRHPVLVSRAGVAGIGNDIDERRLVILLGDGGGIHALGHQTAGLDGADGQAHGEPYPLTRDGAFQENRLPVQGLVAGDDLEGQVLRSLVAVAAVCHAGDLGKYLFANIRDQRRNSSHVTASNFDK